MSTSTRLPVARFNPHHISSRLRPGGWFDQLEMSIQFRSDDGTVTDDHVLAVWSKTFIEAGEKFGKTFRIADLAKGYMQQAGFHNVTEHRMKLPVGQWSRDKKLKKLGMWNLVHCEQGIEGWAMALLTRVMGVSPPSICSSMMKHLSMLSSVVCV